MTATRVMIVGASTDRSKFGNKAVRAFLEQGFEVLPVNPKGGEIEGLKAYASIADVPGPIDRASFYLPPARMPHALEEVKARGDVSELWLNPGTESPEVLAKAGDLGLEVIQACSIMAVGSMPD